MGAGVGLDVAVGLGASGCSVGLDSSGGLVAATSLLAEGLGVESGFSVGYTIGCSVSFGC